MFNVRSFLLTAFMGVACSPAVAVLGDTADDEPDVSRSRFVGTWFIEETVPHATYFASTWRLAPDGALMLVEDHSVGGDLNYPAVSRDGDAAVACHLGDRWSSSNDVTLTIGAQCSDGLARSIDLAFVADASGDAQGVSPEWFGVDGDTTWSEPVWGWRFFRCDDDRSNCVPWG